MNKIEKFENDYNRCNEYYKLICEDSKNMDIELYLNKCCNQTELEDLHKNVVLLLNKYYLEYIPFETFIKNIKIIMYVYNSVVNEERIFLHKTFGSEDNNFIELNWIFARYNLIRFNMNVLCNMYKYDSVYGNLHSEHTTVSGKIMINKFLELYKNHIITDYEFENVCRYILEIKKFNYNVENIIRDYFPKK